MAKTRESNISGREPIEQAKLHDHERIAQRAYELYEIRGRQDGFDLQDWLQAEQQILDQGRSEQSARPGVGGGQAPSKTSAKSAQ